MFSLMVKKDFIAQHFLVGGDWGTENQKHSHHYELELEIEKENLNNHNYLLDIVDVEKHLVEITGYFADMILNDLPEFKYQNPSIEFFCKILWEKFDSSLKLPFGSEIIVRLWENNIACASYRNSKK